MEFSPKLTLDTSGIFVAEDFNEGEVVCIWNEGAAKTQEDLFNTRRDPSIKLFMVFEDSYITNVDERTGKKAEFKYSCNPNVWFDEANNTLVARRPLSKGTQITFDFATSETEMSFNVGVACECGSPTTCRGAISGTEYRYAPFCQRYKGHMSRYVGKKSRSCAYNHPSLSLRTVTKNGTKMKGLFTSKKIRKGEVVLVFAGKLVTREELEQYPTHVLHLTLQVHYNLWQAPDLTVDSLQISDYINHSCGANCALLDTTTMIAFRDIEAGEELTFDYGTVQDGTSVFPCDNFDCHCGAPECRHIMSPRDYQLKSVQDRYWPYFPPFVKMLIEKGRNVGEAIPP